METSISTEMCISCLSSQIEEELRCNCSHLLAESCHPMTPIYKVPASLRDFDVKSYEPKAISIGPYHCGKKPLQAMQLPKWSCLSYITNCINPSVKVEDYLGELMLVEEKVRGYYPDLHEIDRIGRDEFVKMLLLDSCLLLYLLRALAPTVEEKEARPAWFDVFLAHDLFLLENQLPFFILEKIHQLAVPDQGRTLKDITKDFVCQFFKKYSSAEPNIDNFEPDHLLHFAYYLLWPERDTDPPKEDTSIKNPIKVPNAVELWESGIRFVKAREGSNLLDVKFNNGTIEIPCLHIDDNTNPLFRNLIMYEQSCSKQQFTSYVRFMSNLINNASDVKLLEKKGIIQNHLSSDQETRDMLCKLSVEICMLPEPTYLKKLFEEVNKFRCSKVSRWEAWLRHEYNNPWIVLSMIAAIIILICTIVQTVCAIVQTVCSCHSSTNSEISP